MGTLAMSNMYYRLCSSLKDNGILISDKEDFNSYIKNKDNDHYLSVYKYNQEQFNYFQTSNSVAGITDVKTNNLYFDFDSSNLSESLVDTQKMVEKLVNLGIEETNIQAFFSGGKGFHLLVESRDNHTPNELKQIATKLAKGLKTFDSSIYNSNRILRVVNTKHQTTGLYKIQLSIDQLFDSNLVQIKDLAKNIQSTFKTSAVKLPPALLALVKQETIKPTKVESELDLTTKPKFLSDWKYALSQGFFPEGTQNDSVMILASTYRSNNFDQETAYHMIKAACEKQANRLGKLKISKDSIWERIEHVYSDTWNGGTYSEDNFPVKLQTYLEELNIPRRSDQPLAALQSVNDIFDTFESYAENIEKNTIKTGIKGLDKNCRITTSMLVGLLGSPGSGKTSSVLNILNNMSLGGEESIFFSLDMGKPLIYQKLAQRFTGMSGEDVFKVFVDKNEEKKEYIRSKIQTNYENVKMCFKTGASVDDMRKYIMSHEEKTGRKVRLIVVDYLEKVVGPYSDPSVNAGTVAKQLQEVANDLELCVIVLLQPQKMAGTPADPITSYRQIKGASVIEQDCRVVISVYREGYDSNTNENDNTITFAILKNTMGSMGKFDCGWEGKTGKVYELEDIERAALADLREMKALARESRSNDF